MTKRRTTTERILKINNQLTLFKSFGDIAKRKKKSNKRGEESKMEDRNTLSLCLDGTISKYQ